MAGGNRKASFRAVNYYCRAPKFCHNLTAPLHSPHVSNKADKRIHNNFKE